MKTRHLILSALGGLILGLAQLVYAHAYPKQMTPAAGATVTTAPKEVRILFDDELEASFSSITVSGADGKQVNTAKAVVDASNHKLMTVVLPVLAPGKYKVRWVAVAKDSHRTKGTYSFTVK